MTYISCKKCHLVVGNGYHLHFYISDKHPSGYRPVCRKCTNTTSTTYYQKVGREKVFQSKYGISVTQAVSLWSTQGKCCKACKRKIPKPPNPLSPIDHSAKTGLVRGVLCRPCNLSYGLLKENADNIEGLLKYHQETKHLSAIIEIG